MRECSERCIELKVDCPITDCRQWINYSDDLNCTLIAVDKHPKMTLREVSERLGVSFVRIKQIQDKALLKASKNKDIASFFES